MWITLVCGINLILFLTVLFAWQGTRQMLAEKTARTIERENHSYLALLENLDNLEQALIQSTHANAAPVRQALALRMYANAAEARLHVEKLATDPAHAEAAITTLGEVQSLANNLMQESATPSEKQAQRDAISSLRQNGILYEKSESQTAPSENTSISATASEPQQAETARARVAALLGVRQDIWTIARQNEKTLHLSARIDGAEVSAIVSAETIDLHTQRPVRRALYTQNAAKKLALEALARIGRTELEILYWTQTDHVLTLCIVPVQDGVQITTQKICLKIALDNGRILSYTGSFATKPIPLEQAQISAAQAKEALPNTVTAQSARLQLRSIDGQTLLCYAVTATDAAGHAFLFYLDANTAQIRAMQRLIHNDTAFFTIS